MANLEEGEELAMYKTRRQLYKAARILGDMDAISKGRYPQRLFNRYLFLSILRLFRH